MCGAPRTSKKKRVENNEEFEKNEENGTHVEEILLIKNDDDGQKEGFDNIERRVNGKGFKADISNEKEPQILSESELVTAVENVDSNSENLELVKEVEITAENELLTEVENDDLNSASLELVKQDESISVEAYFCGDESVQAEEAKPKLQRAAEFEVSVDKQCGLSTKTLKTEIKENLKEINANYSNKDEHGSGVSDDKNEEKKSNEITENEHESDLNDKDTEKKANENEANDVAKNEVTDDKENISDESSQQYKEETPLKKQNEEVKNENVEKVAALNEKKPPVKNKWKNLTPKLSRKFPKEKKTYNFDDVLETIQILRRATRPSTMYTSLSSYIKKSTAEWKENFLKGGALELLLNILAAANQSQLGFSDAILQLGIVQCIKSVLNCEIGLIYLTEIDSHLMQEFVQSK